MPVWSEPSPSAFSLRQHSQRGSAADARAPSINLEKPIDPPAPKNADDGARPSYAVNVRSPLNEPGAAASSIRRVKLQLNLPRHLPLGSFAPEFPLGPVDMAG